MHIFLKSKTRLLHLWPEAEENLTIYSNTIAYLNNPAVKDEGCDFKTRGI